MPIDVSAEALLKEMRENELSLLVVKGEQVVFRSRLPGLKTLALVVKEKPELLTGSIVVDKVVGVAAAILLVSVKPKQVIGAVMSLGAQERLAREEAAPHARELVEMILDESREALDPMEAKAMGGMAAESVLESVL